MFELAAIRKHCPKRKILDGRRGRFAVSSEVPPAAWSQKLCARSLEKCYDREEFMGEKSGPQEAVEGVVEGVKGKAKEVIGAVTGRDNVKKEGEAQQDKGEAQRDAAKREAEAESARGAAKAAEERQKANQ
jgi:uncharacterized protein YjbJ (UPF0337 family)